MPMSDGTGEGSGERSTGSPRQSPGGEDPPSDRQAAGACCSSRDRHCCGTRIHAAATCAAARRVALRARVPPQARLLRGALRVLPARPRAPRGLRGSPRRAPVRPGPVRAAGAPPPQRGSGECPCRRGRSGRRGGAVGRGGAAAPPATGATVRTNARPPPSPETVLQGVPHPGPSGAPTRGRRRCACSSIPREKTASCRWRSGATASGSARSVSASPRHGHIRPAAAAVAAAAAAAAAAADPSPAALHRGPRLHARGASLGAQEGGLRRGGARGGAGAGTGAERYAFGRGSAREPPPSRAARRGAAGARG